MADELVNKVLETTGRIVFRLSGINEKKAINLVYDFLAYLGEPRVKRPSQIGDWHKNGKKEILCTLYACEHFETSIYYGTFIRAMQDDDRGEFKIDIGGHPSSEVYLKLKQIEPILEDFLKDNIKPNS